MSSLLPHLLAESAGIEEYLALLAEEERAMADGRFKGLPALTALKAALQERMAELDRQREARQLALGFAGGRAGADAAAQAGGEATCTAWAALLGLAERAKAANRRNASMVFGHLDFTQNALRFLRDSGQQFYGPDGARKAPGGAGTRLALG
jgi:flagella synthesis protein FlgN